MLKLNVSTRNNDKKELEAIDNIDQELFISRKGCKPNNK